MKIQRSIHIEASPESVWRVLGDEYGKISKWASGVHHSSNVSGPKPAGAHSSGRDCQTGMGPISERFTAFDDASRTMVYDVNAQKVPFFVTFMQSAWAVHAEAGGGSRVDMEMELKLMFPFNLLMGFMMKRQMGGSMLQLIEDLKHFVEHGEAHPRKKHEEQLALADA